MILKFDTTNVLLMDIPASSVDILDFASESDMTLLVKSKHICGEYAMFLITWFHQLLTKLSTKNQAVIPKLCGFTKC